MREGSVSPIPQMVWHALTISASPASYFFWHPSSQALMEGGSFSSGHLLWHVKPSRNAALARCPRPHISTQWGPFSDLSLQSISQIAKAACSPSLVSFACSTWGDCRARTNMKSTGRMVIFWAIDAILWSLVLLDDTDFPCGTNLCGGYIYRGWYTNKVAVTMRPLEFPAQPHGPICM